MDPLPRTLVIEKFSHVLSDLCFQSLREIQLHDLTTHLDIFEDHRENDYEEMQHRFQDLQMEFKYPFLHKIHACSYLGSKKIKRDSQ